MIRRIELTNFMSHAKTVIEPAAGLTVLQGPNNCGKSALVAALQILCTNDNSTYVMRHAQKECSVTLETDDGHSVTWKRKTAPSYVIDGKLFDRLNLNGLPAELHAVLRMPIVESDNGKIKFDVHFGEQKSPVFLIDESGSHAAQFFAASSDAARMVEMQRLHNQKMGNAQRERGQLDTRVAGLAVELQHLSGVDELSTQMGFIESDYQSIGESIARIDRTRQDLLGLQKAEQKLSAKSAEWAAVAPLPSPPVLIDTAPLAKLIEEIGRLQRDLNCQTANAAALSSLLPCPDFTGQDTLAVLVDHLKQASQIHNYADARCQASANLAPAPVLTETLQLVALIKELGLADTVVTAAHERLLAMQSLAPAPTLVDETELKTTADQLRQAGRLADRAVRVSLVLDSLAPLPLLPAPTDMMRDLAELNQSQLGALQLDAAVVDVVNQLTDTENQLRQLAALNPVCRTCGGVLDPARLIHLAGASHE